MSENQTDKSESERRDDERRKKGEPGYTGPERRKHERRKTDG